MSWDRIFLPSSGGTWISQTGEPTPKGRWAIILAIFFQKVHEIENKLDPEGERVPLGSFNAFCSSWIDSCVTLSVA